MKKAICILMLLCVLFGVVGCSAPSTDTTTPPQGTQAAATKGSAASAPPPSEPAGNRPDGWIADEMVTVDVMISEAATSKLESSVGSLKIMEERKGISVNYIPVPSADYDQKKQTLMATDDVPEVMQATKSDLNMYGRAGVFFDITEGIKDMPHFYELYQSIDDIKFQLVDGRMYGIPSLSRYEVLRGNCLMIRKDLFEDHNIKIPTTFDELYAALKTLKEIYPDSIPYISRNGAGNIMSTLGYAMGSGNNLTFSPQTNGGEYVFCPAYEPALEVLTFLNTLYKEGLMDPDYTNVTNQQWQEKIANGTGFVYFDNPTMAAGNNLKALQEIKPDAEWSPVITPTNSYGYSRATYNAVHQLNRIWAISGRMSQEKVDIVLQMFDWLFSEEGCDVFSLGIEGEDFVREANGDITFTQEFIQKYTKEDGSFDADTVGREKAIFANYSRFVPYSDMHSYEFIWPQYQLDWYKNFHAVDPAFEFPAETPPFTDKETDRIAALKTALETESARMYDNLIMGMEDLSLFASYVETYTRLGYEEYEDIYNTARERALSQ